MDGMTQELIAKHVRRAPDLQDDLDISTGHSQARSVLVRIVYSMWPEKDQLHRSPAQPRSEQKHRVPEAQQMTDLVGRTQYVDLMT